MLAQTVDLNGDLDDQIAVLDHRRRSLVLSFGGLLGYLGVNRAGLAVGLNLVLGGQWRPGVPPYLAIRHLLDTADNVEDAVKQLRDLPLASSRSIMLCDPERAGYVEVLGDEVRFHRQLRARAHQPLPGPGVRRARRAERVRPQLLGAPVRHLPAGAGRTCRSTRARSSTSPYWRARRSWSPTSGDMRRERTVAAVVALPGRGELHVRPGDPSQSDTEVFRLR